jgi:monoamine oxidase
LSIVTVIEECQGRVAAHCQDGTIHEADAAIICVPLPILREIILPDGVRENLTASADIGFGNVVKILLRFASKWWTHCREHDFSELSFLFSRATVPVWWTQHPSDFPVLTGWFAGPKADTVARLTVAELVTMGFESLAEIFNVPPDRITRDLITSQAINWGNDPFTRGAYSYATPKTRQAQAALRKLNEGNVSFSGEALYAGWDIGTVEAALTAGKATAQAILAARQ